jgi:hypothetical protein
MLISREHSPFLERISKFEIKRLIIISILLSLILNIGHIFQYQISGYNAISDPFYNSNYLYTDFYSYPFIASGAFNFFSIYSILYLIVNFFVFLILNTTVEIVIVRKLQKELLEKRKRLEQLNQMDMGTRKKLEMYSKKELRAIVMVIMNSLINFFLRLPEILVFISSSNYIMKNFNAGPSVYGSSNQIANFDS